VFTVEMLPARFGDALLVEYGSQTHPHRILIDGGTAPTIDALVSRLERIPSDERNFELLMVTHIDTDHIGGVLNLLGDRTLGITFDDVWFNGWRHLPDVAATDRLGPIDGEIMTIFLDGPNHADQPYRWNRAFGGSAAALDEDGSPTTIVLEGGMRITVLSPGKDQLQKLKRAWTTVVRQQGWTEEQVRVVARAAAKKKGVRLDEPGLGAELSVGEVEGPLGTTNPIARWAAEPFVCDTAPANGSTIAVLAEYEDKSVLLTGDGYPTVLKESIAVLLRQRGQNRLRLSACKLAHHGSRGNTSGELLDQLACTNYLISTNGARFHHPDPQAIARVIVRVRQHCALHFNYASEESTLWDQPTWMRDHGYSCHYPPQMNAGYVFSAHDR